MSHYYSIASGEKPKHKGVCCSCGWNSGYLDSWEQCRIAAGRKPKYKPNWKDRYNTLRIKVIMGGVGDAIDYIDKIEKEDIRA